MPKFFCNKLARDKNLITDNAARIEVAHHYLDGKDLQVALQKKLIEEAAEVSTATSKERIIAELADVLEVIDGLCKAFSINKNELLAAKEKDFQRRGGFETGLYVETILMLPIFEQMQIDIQRSKQFHYNYPHYNH